jgi:hypothetical protein
VAQEEKVPNKEMPKDFLLVGGCPMLGVSSHLLLLTETDTEGKAKKARLRAKQGGRVAKGKKGRLRAAWGLLRHLWGKISFAVEWPLYPTLSGPYNRSTVHRAEQARRPERKGESSNSLRPVPPQEKAR